MYLAFEESGLIIGTEQYEEKQKEKETATDQSASLLGNNTNNAISMLNLA